MKKYVIFANLNYIKILPRTKFRDLFMNMRPIEIEALKNIIESCCHSP